MAASQQAQEVAITIRIDPRLYKWIKANADREKRSLNAQIGLTLEKAHNAGIYPIDLTEDPQDATQAQGHQAGASVAVLA